ncbi:MAG: hypothetical protein WDW36_003742 [Sanguina aurantia]
MPPRRSPPSCAMCGAVLSAEATASPSWPYVTEEVVQPPPSPSLIAKPGDLDATNFKLHSSVAMWQNYASLNQDALASADGPVSAASIQQLLSRVQERLSASGALGDSASASYWAYHMARMSFFITSAVAGLVAHHTSQAASTAAPLAASDGKSPLQRLSDGGTRELSSRVLEAVGTFSQDLDAIRSGNYSMPWDMTTLGHKQYSPLFMANGLLMFMSEAAATLQRRTRESADSVWLSAPNLYPEYFAKTYHFQTDGWMSERSATIYEHSTETLFFGRQDAMQRSALMPIADFMAGRNPRDTRCLEIAAGTGRFHTFLKDNYPEMPSVCSDLSPFYLAKARSNLSYWKRMRQTDSSLGGADDTGVHFLQTSTENIASPDASFDIVVCMYLFHELPPSAREASVAEMYRVLKPGGLAVFTDSVQMGDRPEWDATIGLFEKFNEPYYPTYITCDMGKLFGDAGFQCDTKYLSSATKTLSFKKPM